MSPSTPALEGNPAETRSDLEQRLVQLDTEIRRIETQLGDRNKQDAQGRRLSAAAYHRWRHQALTALSFKKTEQQQLKAQWAARLRAALTPALPNEALAATALLHRAYALVTRLLTDAPPGTLNLTTGERATLTALREHLQRHLSE